MLHSKTWWTHSLHHLSSMKMLSLKGQSASKPGPLKGLYTSYSSMLEMALFSLWELQHFLTLACVYSSVPFWVSIVHSHFPLPLPWTKSGSDGHSSSINRQSRLCLPWHGWWHHLKMMEPLRYWTTASSHTSPSTHICISEAWRWTIDWVQGRGGQD